MADFDAVDFKFTTVTGENVQEIIAYVPRPKWQRRLSWLIRKWRYPRAIKLL